MVDTDDVPSLVAAGLVTPNGLVVTPDGRTLIVAETYARRLSAFDIAGDGSLGNRRVFATVSGEPDGLCIDEEGAVWVALPQESKAIRVRPGGEVVEQVDVPDHWVFSCALGGEDRRTLYLVAGKSTMSNFERLGLDRSLDSTSVSRGWVFSQRVGVRGAGWP
jgi:sugar lactone lactonase YvrE